jgi:hypothetical protein
MLSQNGHKFVILKRVLENPHLSSLVQFSSTELSTASVDKHWLNHGGLRRPALLFILRALFARSRAQEKEK